MVAVYEGQGPLAEKVGSLTETEHIKNPINRKLLGRLAFYRKWLTAFRLSNS